MAIDEKNAETEIIEENENTSTETHPNKEELPATEAKSEEAPAEEAKEDDAKVDTEDGPSAEMATALAQSDDVIKPEKGEIVKGKIISISDAHALVDCGAKSEALLAVSEINGHKIGDEVEALVTETEPFTVSIKIEHVDENIEILQKAFENGIPVTGKITREIKGGFDVDVSGTRAFLPISHLDVNYIKNTSPYVGQTHDFKIIEFGENGKQFVVSRSEILKVELAGKAEELWDTLNAGDIVEGTVRSLQSFGAFIDLGGIEGLLHISELSKDYTTHPSDMLSIGEKVKVQILNADKEKNRISLSMKELSPDPWEQHANDLIIGDSFKGTIVRKADFGLFVQLFPGIDGLLHASQIAPDTTLEDEKYSIGVKLEGWIRSVDLKEKRVGLTLHAMPNHNPWADIAENYTEGKEVEGTIEEPTQYGVFVELEPGLTGLMPLSELKKLGYKNISTDFVTQEKIKVKITTIDTKRQRISLLPSDVPEHIAKAAEEAPKKKNRQRKRDNNQQRATENNDGGVTEFGAILAQALNKKE